MPFGVVMATGGAGRVAALIGLQHTATVLTFVAVAQAVLIPAGVVFGSGRIQRPQWRPGLFTIALGLAVIAGNLGAFLTYGALAVLLLAWLATLMLAYWWLARLLARVEHGAVVDGTWFLAPAASLGVAGATMAVPAMHPQWAMWLSVIVCLIGVAGYACVLVGSGSRLHRRGFNASPLAPWWISAGCGGLATATLGTVTAGGSGSGLQNLFQVLLAITWVAGTFLLVAVLTGCLWYAWRRGRGPWTAVWTPVFSSAVYAAGTESMARLCSCVWLHDLAVIAAVATLALWAINSSLWLRGQIARARGSFCD